MLTAPDPVPFRSNITLLVPDRRMYVSDPPRLNTPVSEIRTVEFCRSLPVVPSNRTTASSVDEAGPERSPTPLLDQFIPVDCVPSAVNTVYLVVVWLRRLAGPELYIKVSLTAVHPTLSLSSSWARRSSSRPTLRKEVPI